MNKVLSHFYIKLSILIVVAVYALYSIYSHLDFLSDPKYIEVINQFRGSNNSFITKLFFNKLMFIYFYLQNLAELFNVYSWILWFGLSSTIIFIFSLFKQVKNISLFYLFIFLGIIFPLGFIKDLKDTNLYLLFLPLITFYISRYLFSLSKKTALLLLGLIIIEFVLMKFWPIKIIL